MQFNVLFVFTIPAIAFAWPLLSDNEIEKPFQKVHRRHTRSPQTIAPMSTAETFTDPPDASNQPVAISDVPPSDSSLTTGGLPSQRSHHRHTRLPPSMGPVSTREAATFTGMPVVPTELVEDPLSRRPHNRHKRSPVTIVPGFTDEVTTFADSPVGPTEVVQDRPSRRPHHRNTPSPATIDPGFTGEATTFSDSPVNPSELTKVDMKRKPRHRPTLAPRTAEPEFTGEPSSFTDSPLDFTHGVEINDKLFHKHPHGRTLAPATNVPVTTEEVTGLPTDPNQTAQS